MKPIGEMTFDELTELQHEINVAQAKAREAESKQKAQEFLGSSKEGKKLDAKIKALFDKLQEDSGLVLEITLPVTVTIKINTNLTRDKISQLEDSVRKGYGGHTPDFHIKSKIEIGGEIGKRAKKMLKEANMKFNRFCVITT